MRREVELTQSLVALERFSRAMTRVAVDALGLPGNVELRVLMLVHFQPGVTPGGIVAATGFRNSAVSRALSGLESDGLVARVPAPFDARSSNVRLTRKGRGRVGRFDRGLAALISEQRGPLHEAWGLVSADDPHSYVSASPLDAAVALTRVGAAYGVEVAEGLETYGVTDSVARFALTLIASRDGVRPSELGRELDLSPSGTSDLLDRLEKAGLIDRRHDDPADRRAVTVHLTTHGDRAAAEKLGVFARHADAIAAALSLTLETARADGAETA